MSFDNYQVPLTALSNADSFRIYINRIFAQLLAGQSGSGSSLPSVAEPDGRLFVVTPANDLYQAQGGSWVAL